MSSFISKRLRVLFLLLALGIASGTVVLLDHLTLGPRLGPHYDFFLRQRSSSPVSREILLINTGETAGNSELFTVLMTLTEMKASDLLLEARIGDSSSRPVVSELDIRRQLNDEFRLLDMNIRSLFSAIRSGSVSPADAPRYVDRLVELTEQGRDRLTSTLVERDEELFRAAGAFGSLWEATDFWPRQEGAASVHTHEQGSIRRVAPVTAAAEHPVFSSLKSRWTSSRFELVWTSSLFEPARSYTSGKVLVIFRKDGTETMIPLDRDGNILVDWPSFPFRRLDITGFIEYEEADRAMRTLLREAEALGFFSQTAPEKIPAYLYDYAAELKEALLNAPELSANPTAISSLSEVSRAQQKRSVWIAARAAYFESLDDYLYGNTEALLVNGYEEIVANEGLSAESAARITAMRDELIGAFAVMRDKYASLSGLRTLLGEQLASSYCIMGQVNEGSAAQSSALLANALLTGSHIKTLQNRYTLLGSLAAAIIIIIAVNALPSAALMFAGIIISAIAATVIGISFIFSGYWIEPLPLFCGSLAGIVFLFIINSSVALSRGRRIREAYGPAVSKTVLDELVRAGRPIPSQTTVENAAIIAVKDPSLPAAEDRADPLKAAKAHAKFRASVREVFTDAGGMIAGCHGDHIIVVFGGPTQRVYNEATRAISGHPALIACSLVLELLADKDNSWRFGMDYGPCAFSWSPQTGCIVNGRAAVRARILLSITSRLRVPAVVSSSVREKLEQPCRKLGSLGQSGSAREEFYELK